MSSAMARSGSRLHRCGLYGDVRQRWGVGSMLIRSVSVHEDSLRLDYCRLDSADACYRFYAAATLPITGEVTESNTFTGQVYAVDSPTNFAAKSAVDR